MNSNLITIRTREEFDTIRRFNSKGEELPMPSPAKVRVWLKSIQHSLDVLNKGEFNPSGKGSKSYHLDNVKNKSKRLAVWAHLLPLSLSPAVTRGNWKKKELVLMRD